jgi:hypothetical protein
MSQRLPSDAFSFYMSLGAGRSYQAVAQHFGVSKQTVTAHATRDKWQEQLATIEAKARAANEKRAIETLEEMNERRLKMWMAVEKRSLEALRNFPMASAMDAVRSLDIANKNIRLIRGEPTERSESSIEAIIKREYELCMRPDEEPRDAQDQSLASVAETAQSGSGAGEATDHDAASGVAQNTGDGGDDDDGEVR